MVTVTTIFPAAMILGSGLPPATRLKGPEERWDLFISYIPCTVAEPAIHAHILGASSLATLKFAESLS